MNKEGLGFKPISSTRGKIRALQGLTAPRLNKRFHSRVVLALKQTCRMFRNGKIE